MASGLLSALKKIMHSFPQDGSGICAPMTGKLISLSEVPDEAFSSGMLGAGAAIIPTDGRVMAPADATVASLPAAGNAVGLLTEEGYEILIHIGIDTFALEGRPFTCHVKEGEQVKKGDLLITADLTLLTEQGYRTCTPVLIANSDEYISVKTAKAGSVTAGDPIIAVQ